MRRVWITSLFYALLLFGLACQGPREVDRPPLSKSILERHRVEGPRINGRYAVVRLPLSSGVTIWNPVQIVRGPDQVMYVANHTGEIYTLHDTDGDGLEDTGRLFYDVRRDGLRAPAGMAFRGRELFVGTAQEVRVYTDLDGDLVADSSYTFWGNIPHSEHPYEWTSALTFGPDDHLYLVLTTDSWNAGAAPDPEGWRGALLRLSPDGRHVERFATGLRSVSSMVFDSHGSLFFIDNQGGGNQQEELNLARRGSFYGHNPGKYGSPSVTDALVELRTDVAPSGLAFNSPSNDFDGTAGDLFVSMYGPGERWNRGSIARIRLQRSTDGAYRAEEIPVIADLPKLSDLEFGGNGDLYVTQVGKTDYWYQPLDQPDGAIYRVTYAPWVKPDSIRQFSDMPARASDAMIQRGRQIFIDAACSACHAVDGKTELLGPNLKDVGRNFSREELLEEIEYPSKRIKPSMAPTRIVKADGEVLLGRVVSTTPEEVRLMVVGNRILDVPRSAIEVEEPVMQSLMWEGLLHGAAEDDVNALLDYLQSLHLDNESAGG